MKQSMQYGIVWLLGIALMSPLFGWSQGLITGTVSDENGMPLPGATIVVEETNAGTTTDFDGNYQISATTGQTLAFGYVGYKWHEERVDEVATINVQLQPANELEEIIVTGYSSQRRSEVTGSAVQVSSDELNQITVPTVDQALQGNVSGLTISANSGTPGSTSQIRIRGVSSITAGNQPLYVIDGVPVTSGNVSSSSGSSFFSALSGLDANNIKSITVLKDASSTAQYGARGSNGVILITTKGGVFTESQGEQKTQFSFNTYYGFQNDATTGPVMLTAAQRFDLYATGLTNDGSYATVDAAKAGILETSGAYSDWDEAGRPEANWAEVITNEDAPIQEYNLSATGGDSKGNFYASLTYLDQEATVIGSEFNRVTGALNIGRKLSDKVEFSSSNSIAVVDQKGVLERSAYFEGPRTVKFFGSPLLMPYDDKGEINLFGGSLPNPLYIAENYINQNKYSRLISNNFIKIEIIKGFDFGSRLNIDYQIYHRKSYSDRNYGYGSTNSGELFDAHRNDVSYVIQNFLDYGITLNEEHEFQFKLLQEYQENKVYFLSAEGHNFPDDGLYYLDSAGSPIATGSSFVDWYVGAYLFSTHYSGYSGRYVADLSFRREGSSRFDKDNRWGNFWSIGAAWNIHKESFLENSNSIDNLKFRSSYGVTGNSNISLNQYQSLFGFDADYAGEGAVYPSTFGNNELSWETSNTLDIALEFGLFDYMINGSIGYYIRTSNDLLLNVPLSLTTGFSSQTRNIGSLVNKGVELDFDLNIIRKENLNLSLAGNVGTNANEVTKLAKDNNGEYITIQSSITRVDVGHPVNGWYMPTWAGVNTETGEEEFFVNGKDGEKTTVFNDAEQVWQGDSSIPTITAGLNLHFDYNGFFLDGSLYYAGGHKVYEGWHRYVNNHYAGFSVTAFTGFASLLTDSWEKPGDNTRNGKISAKTTPWQRHSKYLHDGDFARLRTVTFGHNFSEEPLESLGIDALKIYLRGNNLLTWQKSKDQPYDPEVDLGGQTGLETPPVKSIIVGLNIKF